jgi:hypothetical protein
MNSDDWFEAIGELRYLTECRCDPAWTERGRHETHCASDYRGDVETVALALKQLISSAPRHTVDPT